MSARRAVTLLVTGLVLGLIAIAIAVSALTGGTRYPLTAAVGVGLGGVTVGWTLALLVPFIERRR